MTTPCRPCSDRRCTSLPLLGRGKVREIYALGDGRLLMVTTDRISAFDVVMAEPIPDKGRGPHRSARCSGSTCSPTWSPNHLSSATDVTRGPRGRAGAALDAGRAAHLLPIEGVARGYLAGSGWHEYHEPRQGLRHPVAVGLVDGAELPEPIFTPATKAALGEHDENVDFDATVARSVRSSGPHPRRSASSSTRAPPRRRAARDHPRRHQVRVRARRRRRARARRRGAHPRLVALLAGRRPRPGAASRYDKQFVRD